MQNYSFLFIIISFVILYFFIKHNYSLREKFENSLENKYQDEKKTPAETGLVFGFLPEEIDVVQKDPKYDPNSIYHDTSININTQNFYLGISEKNPLLPVFLNKLGTFTPYEYDLITILKKSNNHPSQPIFYNETQVLFKIKYQQDDYFLQFVPKNNTFYLTNTPSYFVFLNSMDMNSKKEVLFGDSILIKCLDNAEYLLEYQNFLITEKDKSSTFFIKKSEVVDICTSFYKNNPEDKDRYLKQFINKNEISQMKFKADSEISNYINKLKEDNQKKINDLRITIEILQKKKSNLDARNSLISQKARLEINSALKEQQEKLEKELETHKNVLEKEYDDFKNNLDKTKGPYWLNEINKVRKDLCP